MMTGGMFAFLFAGIWNCTYIWPIVIWLGAGGWFGALGGGTVAYGRDLRDAADEEAALILDDQRLLQEFLRLGAFLRQDAAVMAPGGSRNRDTSRRAA